LTFPFCSLKIFLIFNPDFLVLAGHSARCKDNPHSETFEKCSILAKVKEGENFNRRNIWNISRIEV
jgi:hypothetical protein